MNLQVTINNKQASVLATKAAEQMKQSGSPATMQDMVRAWIDAGCLVCSDKSSVVIRPPSAKSEGRKP